MKFISELLVGSFLVYPKGESAASRAARQFIRYEIKLGRPQKIAGTVNRLIDLLPNSPLQGLFSDSTMLVPVPGHAPRYQGALSVAEEISKELVQRGLGAGILPVIERIKPVARSSTLSLSEDRPDPKEHLQSLRVLDIPLHLTSLLLVDDVVTRGSTLIACASFLKSKSSNLQQVSAFSLARLANVDLENTAEMASPLVESIKFDEAKNTLKRDLVG